MSSPRASSIAIARARLATSDIIRRTAVFAPETRGDESILIKSYDSASGGIARFAPPRSSEDPTAPADKLPRDGSENRLLVCHAAELNPR